MKKLFRFPFRRELPRRVPAPATFIICSRSELGTYSMWVENMPRGAHVIRCFLSPLDALIEMAILSKSGEPWAVMPVSAIDRNKILDATQRRLVACVHQGWVARGGQIRLRPNRLPVAEGQLLKQARRGSLLRFGLDASTLEVLDHAYQRAGLFAWRETVEHVARWDSERLIDAAQHALRTMPVGTDTETGAQQLALFDPEFRRWHFVPLG